MANLWKDLVDQLAGATRRVQFAAGLTAAETRLVEERFGFRFPPDLRDFLQTALPSGPRFPNWRQPDAAEIEKWLDLPRQGILFDVEHNGFWMDEWGTRPGALSDALHIASEQVRSAPRLIPVYAHRMMPDEPHSPGNPVFSVHQTDIIHYGFDLADYLRQEFGLSGRASWPEQVRSIRFWDIERFQNVRWVKRQAVFDNSGGQLP